MSEAIPYPDISYTDTLPFQSFLSAAKRYPYLLSDPRCPYDDGTKKVLQLLLDGQNSDPFGLPTGDVPDLFEGKDEWEVFAEQIRDSLNRLNAMVISVKSEPQNVQINFEKSIVSLLDKLTSLKQQTLNLKEMAEFKSLILKACEEILTKEQRTKLMQMLDR